MVVRSVLQNTQTALTCSQCEQILERMTFTLWTLEVSAVEGTEGGYG